MIECQNCWDVGSRDVVSRVALGQYCTEDGLQCQNCGAVAWKNGELFVPRRSLPAKELPLPDADDWWWWWNVGRGKWEPVCVVMAIEPRMSRVGLPHDQPCLPGRYVRLPTPVQPKPAKESTVSRFARMIRENCMEHLRSHYDLTWNECIEIAARLERQGKEPA